MKKAKIYVLVSILPMFFFLMLIVGLLAGGTASAPMDPPATEEEAYKYQYISSELGTPWDIILLTDAIIAEEKGEGSIEDYNPLLGSLEFCVLVETEYQWEEDPEPVPDDPSSAQTADDAEISPEPTPAPEPSGKWVAIDQKNYYGKNQILDYLGYQGNLNYSEVPRLISEINEKASEKSSNDKKYEAIVTVNNDFRMVLKDFVKLEDENIEKVMELYESKYLMYLYAYDSGIEDYKVGLPTLVVGNVTRNELAQVASTLINFPYLFGGKSPVAGPPVSALDCSGFIDWVYIQCFGMGVSGANLPVGINISGTAMQFFSSQEISREDLKIGDLGFYYHPAAMKSGDINHVGIYIGKIAGRDAFIHCGGKAFGYNERPNGRVGISINEPGTYNSSNPITGGKFSPEIKGTNFQFFRRPQFQFIENTEGGNG